jgi:hypothetical protein
MALNSKNIVVGAARLWISYGTGTNRPDLTSANIFPWTVNVNSNSGTSTNAAVSTASFLSNTASQYWRELGFTSNGVDISYEPGYSDVTVDQLLDAARLFQQSLKIMIKTEVNEATFENINVVWGQQESVVNAGSSFATVNTLYATGSTVPSTNPTQSYAQQLNMVAGAIGIAPVERSLVVVGSPAAQFGFKAASSYPQTTSLATVTADASLGDSSSIRNKERVYVARRVVQTDTTAHSLKRDAVTVFPVSFRALPDIDRNAAAGSEYGFIVDRLYSNT